MARISFEEFSAGLPVSRESQSSAADPVVQDEPKESLGVDFNRDRLEMGRNVDSTLGKFKEERQAARSRVESGEITPGAGARQTIGTGLLRGGEVLGQAALGFTKMLLPQSVETRINETLGRDIREATKDGPQPLAGPDSKGGLLVSKETNQKLADEVSEVMGLYKTDENFKADVDSSIGFANMITSLMQAPAKLAANAPDIPTSGSIPVQGLDDAAQTIAIRNGVDSNESVLSEFGENPSVIQPDTSTPAAPQSTIGATVSGVGSQIKEFAGRTAREAQDAAARETRLKALPAPEASVRRAVSDERVIDLVNKLTPEELAVTRRLVEQAKLKEGDITTNTAHPKSLAGAELLKPVDYIIKTRKAVGAKLGNLRTQLRGKKDINTNSAFRSFHTYLKNDFQVQFDKQGQIIPGTGRLARGDVGEIQNLYNELRSKTFASQREIDEFLQRSFKDYDLKQAREKTFSDDVTRIAGRARQDMRQLMPEQYNVLSTEYAKLSTPLTDIIKLLGYKGDLDALTAKDLKAGEIGLRVLGNAADRPQSIIDEIVRVANDNGYKSGVNLNNIIALTDQLEGLYDITMPRSFSGQVTSGMDNSNALGAMGDAATMNIGGLYNRAAQSRASQVEIQEAFDTFLKSKS